MKLNEQQDLNKEMSKQQKQELQEFLKLRADMKAYLKQLSKNQLIQHIFELTDIFNAERLKNKELSTPKAENQQEEKKEEKK